MKLIPRYILLLFTGLSFGSGANDYSDADRGLFTLSKSSAIAGSDFVFAGDGTPQVNAANLAFDSLSEISCSYAGFYQNIFSTSVMSYATKINENSGLAFSLNYLYDPGLPYNDNFQTENVGGVAIPIYDSSLVTYHTESLVFFHAAYGRKLALAPGIDASGGIAINAERYSLPPYRGYGLGCDAGAAVDFVKQGLRFGLQCQNLTTNYIRWSASYSEEAYPHAFFGIGWRTDIPYLYGSVQIQFKSLDLLGNEGVNATMNSTVDSTASKLPAAKHFTKDPLYFLVNGAYGLEYTIMNVATLRLGIPVGGSTGTTDWSAMAFGCGVNLMKKKLSLDFAYVTQELGSAYQVGLTYFWKNDIIKD
jgi:hypothetical protein